MPNNLIKAISLNQHGDRLFPLLDLLNTPLTAQSPTSNSQHALNYKAPGTHTAGHSSGLCTTTGNVCRGIYLTLKILGQKQSFISPLQPLVPYIQALPPPPIIP